MYRPAAVLVALLSFLPMGAANAQFEEPPRRELTCYANCHGARYAQLIPSQHSPSGRVRHLRLSPDGHYVLAQDKLAITVLTAQPLAVLFRASTESASLAEFSPDSQEILFVSSVTRVESDKLVLARSAPHVERWSITLRKRIESTEIRSPACGTMKLSPNGRILGCVDFAGTLRFIDVASGETILEKKDLNRPWVNWGQDETGMFTRHERGDLGEAQLQFSPDGRFVLVEPGGNSREGPPFGWDTVEKKEVRLGAVLRQRCHVTNCVFVAADQVLILVAGGHRPQGRSIYTGAVVAFPAGTLLSRPNLPVVLWHETLPGGEMYLAAESGFLIFRLCEECHAAALEYRTGQMITTKSPVLDVLGNHYVAERANGELGLYERGKPAAIAAVRLDAR